jgi:hypothetical protein
MQHPYSGSGLYYGYYGDPPHSDPMQTLLTQYWHQTHYPSFHKKSVHVYYINPAFVPYYMNY